MTAGFVTSSHKLSMDAHLPVELWTCILARVSIADISRVASASKTLSRVCGQNALWKLKCRDVGLHAPKAPLEALQKYQSTKRMIRSSSISTSLQLHSHGVSCFAIDGRYVYTGGWDGYIHQTHIADGHLEWSVKVSDGPIRAIALSNGRLVVGLAYAPFLSVWDVRYNKKVKLQNPFILDAPMVSLATGANFYACATVSRVITSLFEIQAIAIVQIQVIQESLFILQKSGRIKQVDSNGEHVADFYIEPNALCFHVFDFYTFYSVVAGYKDGAVLVYTARKGSEVKLVNEFTSSGGWTSSVAHKNGMILSASWDGNIRVWDSSSGEMVLLNGPPSGILAMHVTDSATIISGHYDGTLKYWS